MTDVEGPDSAPEPEAGITGMPSMFRLGLTKAFGDSADPGVELRDEGEDASRGATRVEHLAKSRTDARYALKGEVGRGAMGAVLRVVDNDLRRDLAMKVILGRGKGQAGDTAGVDSAMLARFLEEAQVTGQLEHPGIVPVHELGIDAEGHVYFTMQLVRGRDFKKVLELVASGAEGWNTTRALGVLLKVCEAMAYAHDKGVVHRDLKPANVMVGKYGEVYVMDWGLARVEGREDCRDLHLDQATIASLTEVRTDRKESRESDVDSPILTMDGTVMGTPAYMPPEQARGELERVGPRSDVYALGAMLYQLLTGEVPFVPSGAKVSPRTLLMRVMEGPPKPVHELTQGSVPAELVAISEKAMARDPEDRYPDMGALAADLRAYLEGRVVAAYQTGAVAEFKKWVQRNRPLAAALIAGVLALAAGLVTSLAFKSRSDANAALAMERAEEARHERDNVLRLSAFQELQDLRAEAATLWPPYPARMEGMRDWLERAQALIDGLEPNPDADDPGHRAQLAKLRARALPQTPEERERDRESHPRMAELRALEARLEKEAFTAQDDAAVQAVAELEAEVEALRAEVDERHRLTFTFTNGKDAWWHAQLEKLVAEIEAFAEELAGRSAGRGWGTAHRIADWVGGDYLDRWEQHEPAIRAAYPELTLPVQVGLVPIGPDPDSELWEFWVLGTGSEPRRSQDGRLLMTEESGLVLVLLPGGSFWMGAQSSDPEGRNFDVRAMRDESPVHEVTLTPFFISKYEMTDGQWNRVTGAETVFAAATPVPVPSSSWDDCMEWLPRMGAGLPSEAQWEYGARARTSTPWWTGEDEESLEGAANVAPFGTRAPVQVGTLAANAFGFHDVLGNLWEWCLDGYDEGFYGRASETDPVSPWEDAEARVVRGGSFARDARDARSARRYYSSPSLSLDVVVGVRPVRTITE